MVASTTHNQTDSNQVKSAASNRWFSEILPALGFDRDDLDGRHHPCTKCGGTDRFRAIDAEAGAVYCNNCFNEENGDGFAAAMWLNNWTFPQAVKAVAEYLGIGGSNSGSRKTTDIVELIAKLKRIPLDSFIEFGAHEAQRGKLTVARLPMYGPNGRTSSYCDFSDISPEFLKGMSAKKMPTGLYYAERPKPGDTILITEGPKDAAALHALGFKAVGLPTCKLANKFAREFAGCDVVLVPDLDTTGEESAPINAARLKGIAATVCIARLPGEMKSKDGDGVREVLSLADGEALLRQAIEDAQPWEPIATQAEEEGPPQDQDDWTSIKSSQGRTEIANSRRFLQSYGETVRYCAPWGKWLIWDGTRWGIDHDGAVMRLAKAVADAVWNAALDCLTDDVIKFAKATSSHGQLAAMLKLAAADAAVGVDQLDANPWLLNCPNGVVDLRTGDLRPHRREDYVTKLCPTPFNPDASSVNWQRFLHGVFGGDRLTIGFLQRLVGYYLTGVVSEQILSVFHGSGGNGKSTFLNAAQATFGTDYSSAAPAGLLMEKHGESHPTELAGLFGMRLVVAQESAAGGRFAETTVKQLTGGDKITARLMRQDFWSFSPTHKLVMATNHKPRIKGTDHAIWRRLVLVPFERRFWNPASGDAGPEELRQDKDLPAKLEAEAEGILAWAVRGCLDWQSGGLQIPASVRAATNGYRTEEDSLGRFVADCCLTGNVYKVKFKDLYQRLEDWSNDNGDNLPSRKIVGQWLKESGFRDRNSGVVWYEGIALRNELSA